MNTELALFSNDAFYLAFAAGDLDAMDELWARHHPVACIHPGWPVLDSREAVIESWRRILAAAEPPTVTVHHPRAYDWGSVVLVTCYEAIGDQMLVASNLFVAEAGTARLVHHQAGPCADPPAPDPKAGATLQ